MLYFFNSWRHFICLLSSWLGIQEKDRRRSRSRYIMFSTMSMWVHACMYRKKYGRMKITVENVPLLQFQIFHIHIIYAANFILFGSIIWQWQTIKLFLHNFVHSLVIQSKITCIIVYFHLSDFFSQQDNQSVVKLMLLRTSMSAGNIITIIYKQWKM